MVSTYKFELTGITPAIMHADDIEQTDMLKEFRNHPDNKKSGVAGDDRSPAWSWQTYLYTDGQKVVAPQDNIMSCLRKAGCSVGISGKKTFKQLTQSGMGILNDYCEFEGGKGEIFMEDIDELRPLSFREQSERAKDLGFRLFCKRAKVGTSKHVRVRPTFDDWKIRGQLEVFDELLTFAAIKQIFDIAGNAVGLFDWRPSSEKSPGPYGRFTAKVTPVKK